MRRIRNLRTRAARDRTGLFFVEGVRFLAEAVQHRVTIETLVVARPLLLNPFGQKLVRLQRAAGVPCLEVTPEIFHDLSLAEEPQGVGAVLRQSWEPLERVRASDGLCWIAVEEVHSPGNLGSILRTSEAVGGAGLLLIGHEVDPYHPAAVRASMGAMFSQRFVRTTLRELMEWKQRYGCRLVGTSPSAAAEYQAVSYPPPLVLLMGGERRGLPSEQQALCDVTVRIPMVGGTDSLNLAVATGVMLYEIFNQRRAGVSTGTRNA